MLPAKSSLSPVQMHVIFRLNLCDYTRGDHPFVIKETALVLKRTRPVAVAKIASNIPLHFAQRPPLDAAVLQRLQAEAKASGCLPPAWIDDLP